MGPRPNMCTGLVAGAEFVAFNDSPVCASFAAPAPPHPGPATPARVAPRSPQDVALVLMDRAVALAPAPTLRVAPARIGLTGLDSFYWTRPPRPIQVTASVPGLDVTAEAHPVQYVWDFGEGSTRTTSTPGRRWTERRPGNVAHLYERRGVYRIGLEVVWEARWRLGSGAWRHLGYFSSSDATDYRVRQMVAVLVKPD